MASMPVLRQFALLLAPAHCGLGYMGLALDTKGGQTTSFLERLRPCPFGLGFTVALDELLLRRRIERADQILQDRHGALTFVVEKGVHRSGTPSPHGRAHAAARRGRELPTGQTLAGVPSKKARSPIWVVRRSTRLAMCSRTQRSTTGTEASASLWVSHRLSDTHFRSPRSARPYRMKPGCSWSVRSIPSRAISASSWNVPSLISYVAMRTCCMCALLRSFRTRNRPRANVSQIESRVRSGYQAFAETSNGTGSADAISVTPASPIRWMGIESLSVYVFAPTPRRPYATRRDRKLSGPATRDLRSAPSSRLRQAELHRGPRPRRPRRVRDP